MGLSDRIKVAMVTIQKNNLSSNSNDLQMVSVRKKLSER